MKHGRNNIFWGSLRVGRLDDYYFGGLQQYGSTDMSVPDDFKREASTPGGGSSSGTPQPPLSRKSRASAGGEARGKPGRKTLDELMQRYRDKLTLAWNAVHNFKVRHYFLMQSIIVFCY